MTVKSFGVGVVLENTDCADDTDAHRLTESVKSVQSVSSVC